ncbi:acetolactate synthase [Paractinoplanes deccanensis]|uniref:Acetolactate synthase n=1 Tax=Paractinoplanes deccanensis TaxID=113561 RepID=A0ABQ3YHP0_9ACTN|nr:thiamine pyrophosphate-binding protein [Actinoplanes deccanensis]GID79533.1 acetolactate synthase [Actinoplanes deccanensis]
MAGPTHARALAEAVLHSGRSHVFALTGDDNAALVHAFRERGVEVVQARHESAAMAMAEGYASETGRPSVCSVPHGLGLSEMAASLRVASRNRSAVVLIAAATDQGVAAYRRMWPGEEPAAALADALSLAADRLRPVVLGVDAELLTSPVRVGTVRLPAPRPRTGVEVGDDEAAARRLTAVLSRGRRPVLVAGRGVLAAGCADLVRELAEHTGAALATTLPAKGLFDGHTLDLGLAGGLAHPAADRVLRAADVVLGFGATLGRLGRQCAAARVVRVVDQDSAGGETAGGEFETLIGNAAEVLTRLRGTATRRPPWFEPVGPASDCWRADLRDFAPPIAAGTVDPRLALAGIGPLIPPDAVVVVGGGRGADFACALVARPRDGRFLAAGRLGLPTAVGTALASPRRKVVVFEGDGDFASHAHELGTARRAGADLTVFVLNDGASTVAGAGARIVDGESAGPVAREALRPGIAVVEVRTDPSVVHRRLRLKPHS